MANTAKKQVRKIYLASDAMWDLRQGTLTRISPEFAAAVTSEESYYTRDQDVFTVGGETLRADIYEGVRKRYAQEIVRMSLRTTIFEFLRSLCKEYIKHSVITPFMDDFALQLNAYPFVFSEEEQAELVAAIKNEVGEGIPVEIVYHTLDELTPSVVRERYSAMVVYHWYEWMNVHADALKRSPLLEVGVYGPRVYFLDKGQIPEDLEKELAKRNTDLFHQTELTVRPVMVLQLLPVALFSAATPANKPEFRRLVKTQV